MFIKRFMPYFDVEPGGGSGGNPPKTDPPVDPKPPVDPTPKGADKTFTQEDVDRIIKERLDREKRKADEKAENARKEAERKALEEQGKYKEMYEQLQKDLEAEKSSVLEIKKATLLLGAGYTQEQADRYVKYLTGETEDDLKTSLEALKADIPPKTQGVDPQGSGNRQKVPPAQEDTYAFGKELFERLKKGGRIRKK